MPLMKELTKGLQLNKLWIDLKQKALNTEYARWRRVVSTILLSTITIVTVVTIWYLFFFNENMECMKGIVYLSIPWIVVQLVVITHLYFSNTISAIVRGSQKMMIAIGNIWLILYVFSLDTCG